MRHTEPCTLICDRWSTVIGAKTIKPFVQRTTIATELLYEIDAEGCAQNLYLRKTGPLLEFLVINVRDEDALWFIELPGRDCYQITLTDDTLAVHTAGIVLDHLHGAEDLAYAISSNRGWAA